MSPLGPVLLGFLTVTADPPVYTAGRLDPAVARWRVETFGPDLELVATLPGGGSHTVRYLDGRLYTGCRHRLQVWDASDPAAPALLGETAPFGHVRHIVVRDGWAFVASRAAGLFVIDVRDPSAPQVAAHYDTVELATGLALSGDVLVNCNRLFGIELIDVSDPLRPRFVSAVRTGEAQLLDIRDRFAYVGVWGSRELVTVDLRDPWRPVVVNKQPLDGFGDGVAVAHGHVYAATGHHRPGMVRYADPTDPAFGQGHGLEVFRLDDPAAPTFVTRLKTMPSYQRGPDCWVPLVSDRHLLLADGLGGLLLCDLADPAAPRFAGQAMLPYVDGAGKHDYAHDVAPMPGYAAVAGAFGGVHLYRVPDLGPSSQEPGEPVRLGPRPPQTVPEGWLAWRGEGQVRAVDRLGERLVAAAGAAGLVVLDLGEELREVASTDPGGIAFDVQVAGDLVFAAAGAAGVVIYRAAGAALSELARVPCRQPARGVVWLPTGHLAVTAGDATLLVVDVRDPAAPQVRYTCGSEGRGLLYGDQVAYDLIAGRYLAVFWHVAPPVLFDLLADPVAPAGGLGPPTEGRGGLIASGEGAVRVFRGGLARLAAGATGTATVVRLPGLVLEGAAARAGDLVYCWNRQAGCVEVLEWRDPDQPRHLETLRFDGYPGRPVEHPRGLAIPVGYDGILLRLAERPLGE